MRHSFRTRFPAALVWLLSLAGAPALAADAAADAAESTALGFERTPPRLSFSDGEVSYWRPGAVDWTAARVNTALAVGDELSTGAGANLELQVGGRAFVRAGEATQLGLTALEPDYLKLRLAAGTASLDLRELTSGQTLEIDTPNAAFTIERNGYYRVEVTDGATTFICRRGGRAAVTTEGGLPAPIASAEQVVVTGTDSPVLATYAAPELDDWDRWNYGRSEEQIAGASSRYVPNGVYGAGDLDDAGNWRVVPTYGAVWVPRVAAGWAPYSAGSWVHDPYYGWTWVDDAPWGWAPFHYGRWIYLSGYWGWSPGPRIVRPYYAPALVAFYGSPSFSVSVSFGQPSFGWVALGWGEPVVPWWGPSGCRGVPRWAGWGGPRVVNNVVVQNTNYVTVNNIERYANAGRPGALVAVDRARFGRGSVREARLAHFDAARLEPVNGRDLGVSHDRRSLSPSERRGTRPSRELLDRRVVTREEPTQARSRTQPREASGAPQQRDRTRVARGRDGSAEQTARPPQRIARAEAPERRSSVSGRPSLGRSGGREGGAPQTPQRTREARGQRTSERAPRRENASPPARPPARVGASERRSSRTESTPAPRARQSAPRSEAPQQPQAQRTRRGAPATRAERGSRQSEQPNRVAEPRQRTAEPPQRAAEPRQRAAEPRQRAAEPRQAPAPGDSSPRSRGGDGNERRDNGGQRSRRG